MQPLEARRKNTFADHSADLLLVQSPRPTHLPTIRLLPCALRDHASVPLLQGPRDPGYNAEPCIRELRIDPKPSLRG